MKDNKHQTQKQQCYSLCSKLPEGAQSFVFSWQIAAEQVNATFLLASKIKNDGNAAERCAPSWVHKNI